MKKKMTSIGIIAVLLGIFISRILTARYGNNGRVIVASIALGISVCALLFIALKKMYTEAIVLLFLVLPAVVVFVGICKDNIFITAAGLLLVCIVIPIIIKIAPRYLKRKNKDK